MAITRTQIAKQLLEQGGRVGLRFGSEGYQGGATNQGGAGPGPGPGPGPGEGNRERGMELSIKDAQRRSDLKAITNRIRDEKIEEKLEPFRDLGGGTRKITNLLSKISPFGKFTSKYLSTFGPLNTKDFFLENYLSSKNAPMTKEEFAMLSEEDKEKEFGEYMTGRTTGKTDAYGNLIGDRDGEGINQILPVDTTFAQASGTTEPEVQEEDDEIINYRLMSKGGRAAFGGGSDMGQVADSKGNVGPGTGGYQGGELGGMGNINGGGDGPTNVGGDNFPEVSPVFNNLNEIDKIEREKKLDAFIAANNILGNITDDDEDEDEKSLQEKLAGGITNQPEFQSKIDNTVSGIMANPDLAALGTITQGKADGGRIGLMGGGMPYEGGIMDLESARQMYGLGKLVKKVTRSVKKIAKSPIGKAALLYAGGSYLSGMGAFGGLKGAGSLSGLFGPKGAGKFLFSPVQGSGSIFSKIPGGKAGAGILGT